MGNIKSVCVVFILVILFLGPSPTVQGQTSLDEIMSGSQEQILLQVPLLIDGLESNPENMPLLLTCGRTVISLQSLQNIIPFQSELGQEGELVLIWEQSRIQLYPGKNEMLVDSIPRSLDIAPLKTVDGSWLLPLRAVGEALGYKIIYDASKPVIHLCSPGYKPLPLTEILPPQPAHIDYNALPTWGSVLSVPGLTDVWPGETIIAGYFTRLVNSPSGRTNNIILSSAKISGKILPAGEIFSFNQTVGPRTVQNGYQNAKIFAGKKVVNGIGGGICQTSSTIYNAALEAGLQIVERYPHSLKVVYAPPHRDATVSWGGADMKFRNTSGFPLKLLCKVENGYVMAVLAKAQPDTSVVSNTTTP